MTFNSLNFTADFLKAVTDTVNEGDAAKAKYEALLEAYEVTSPMELSEKEQACFLVEGMELIGENYVGFDKLKGKLASQGVKDPGALAASIGIKKYGKKKFERSAHEGKKLNESEDLQEVSAGKLSNYISGTRTEKANGGTKDRSKGLGLAIRKKWADKKHGTGELEPKVKANWKEEEAELQEVSKEKLGRYINRASNKISDSSWSAANIVPGDRDKTHEDRVKILHKIGKRVSGIQRASKKLTGKAYVNAEEAHCDEKEDKELIKSVVKKDALKESFTVHLHKGHKTSTYQHDTEASAHRQLDALHDLHRNTKTETATTERKGNHFHFHAEDFYRRPSSIKESSTAFRVIREALEAKKTLAEGLKLIGTHVEGPHHAKVYHNPEYNEYQVKFYPHGKHHEPSDSFSDDKNDAHDTAKQGLKHYAKQSGHLKEEDDSKKNH